ncbi:MAG: Protein serine/threonine phosphatase PrpC, regulation of stationary phase [Rhodanobacteraceae bacterium]|jgi:protein phosphatase|nr:MAG: Protein serine/threonine phosphatase PrpC, regulation of stationary phase [Rhodanobacteraceae bacterium]
MIEIGHASHTGLRRECNEDSYWADTELGLFLVVDGIGGPGRGDAAAAIVRDALVGAARRGGDLESAIRDAGTAIATFASATAQHSPTGATLAALRIDGGQFEAARIGDARIYLWQHGELTPLCTGEPLPSSERETTAGAEANPKRNRITQALGITPVGELDAALVQATLERGMQFLLCSDGLTEELGERELAAMLARSDLAAQECVDQLLLAALDAGGRDNVSVVLVRVS